LGLALQVYFAMEQSQIGVDFASMFCNGTGPIWADFAVMFDVVFFKQV
jgi:hypothetical protein